MPLFRVEVSGEVYVQAKDREDAVRVADRCLRDMVGDDMIGADPWPVAVSRTEDVPSDWRDEYPYAEGGAEVTCRELLTGSARADQHTLLTT